MPRNNLPCNGNTLELRIDQRLTMSCGVSANRTDKHDVGMFLIRLSSVRFGEFERDRIGVVQIIFCVVNGVRW